MFHSGSGVNRESRQDCQRSSLESCITETDPESSLPIARMVYGYDMTEPQTERMNLTLLDGDPSKRLDYQQKVRLGKGGEKPRRQLVSCFVYGFFICWCVTCHFSVSPVQCTHHILFHDAGRIYFFSFTAREYFHILNVDRQSTATRINVH